MLLNGEMTFTDKPERKKERNSRFPQGKKKSANYMCSELG